LSFYKLPLVNVSVNETGNADIKLGDIVVVVNEKVVCNIRTMTMIANFNHIIQLMRDTKEGEPLRLILLRRSDEDKESAMDVDAPSTTVRRSKRHSSVPLPSTPKQSRPSGQALRDVSNSPKPRAHRRRRTADSDVSNQDINTPPKSRKRGAGGSGGRTGLGRPKHDDTEEEEDPNAPTKTSAMEVDVEDDAIASQVEGTRNEVSVLFALIGVTQESISFYSRTASSYIVVAFYASNIFPRYHLMTSRFAATAVPMRLGHWAMVCVSARHAGMRAVSRKTLMLQAPMKSTCTPACANADVRMKKKKLIAFGFSAILLSVMLGLLSQAGRSARDFQRKTPRVRASNALFVLNFAPMMTNCPPTTEMAVTMMGTTSTKVPIGSRSAVESPEVSQAQLPLLQLVLLVHPASLRPPLILPTILAAIGVSVTPIAASSMPSAHGRAGSCLRGTR